MFKRTVITAAIILLTGCGSPEPVPTVTSTVTVTATATATAIATVTATAAPESTEATSASGDATAEVQAVAGQHVTRAESPSAGEYVVWTDLVDPRGANGSPEAQAAVAICEAVQRGLGASNVRVQESDESTFVALGGARASCTEI